MNQCEEIVIVGGGPAGAYCALELAKQGIVPVVFDHSHPREKPCGGGILPLAVERFPIINQFRPGSSSFEKYEIISSTGMQKIMSNLSKGFIISRKYFDLGLLNEAICNGAKLVREKVIDIGLNDDSWLITTNKQSLSARFLIGADGVNSLVRKKIMGPIPKDDLVLTYGYMATTPKNDHPIMKFLDKIPGYAWIFPRENYSSIGIGSELCYGYMLNRLLDDFISLYCPEIDVQSQFAALIPGATNPEFFNLPFVGKNWALIGDSAGHADPINGGGILHALWDGKLLADAIKSKDPNSYQKMWKEEYGQTLIRRSKLRSAFFDPLTIEMTIAIEAYKLKHQETDNG